MLSLTLLDFVRPERITKSTVAVPVEAGAVILAGPLPVREPESYAHKFSCNYPTVASWLKICEEDIERGRDNHEYSKLAPMFAANDCTRIDDIPRMTTQLIRELAAEAGIDATIGLVNRVYQYAVEDVEQVKKVGRL